MQKFKVNGQSVPKIECKQTDGRADGGDCITSLANSVGNQFIRFNTMPASGRRINRQTANGLTEMLYQYPVVDVVLC